MGKIGVVSFTDPRALDLEDVAEEYLKESHKGLVNELLLNYFDVVNPHKKLKRKNDPTYGVRSTKEVDQVVKKLKSQNVDAVVLGCWKWTDPYLTVRLVKELNVPTLVYTNTDSRWSGATLLAAVGASLWEVSPNKSAENHTRLTDDLEGVVKWARGVTALKEMNRSSLLLWGGSYCLRMDVLQDDIPKMKSFLIGDILQEDQYMLVRRAEEILKSRNKRIQQTYDWLINNGAKVEKDGKMITDNSLTKQLALYLAARDRLKELKDENIIGISIKCQPELSIEYGVTACSLPALLPYGWDAQGRQQIMPTVCEGDIKGLWTSAMLHKLNPQIPPLFGDLKFVSDDYFIIANCGASSIYYANNSLDPKKTLPHVSMKPQCQGSSGAAFGYQGKFIDEVTVARLFRKNGEYKMHLGVGSSLDVDESIMSQMLWGDQWPHVAISIPGLTKDRFMEIVGSNHYCMTPGNFEREIEYFCKEAGIEIERLEK